MRAATSFFLLGLIMMTGMIPGSTPVAYGQSKTGTTVGQFLLIEPSARVAAMGNAGVTTFDDATSAYFNPGAAGFLDRTTMQFTHSAWLADINYDYATAAVRFGPNAFLISLTSLNSGDMDVTTVEQPGGTGERFKVQQLALGLGLARRVTDRFSAGLQIKYLSEQIWHSSLSAVALDFGVIYHLPFRAYLGASLSNFGTRGSFDGRDLRIRFDQNPDEYGDNSSLPATLKTDTYPLPILFRVGMGFPLAINRDNEVHLVVDAYHPSDNTESISLGGEYRFMNMLFLRGGYQHLFQTDAETGATLGGGLRYELSSLLLRADYAWGGHGRLGNVQRFSVGVSF